MGEHRCGGVTGDTVSYFQNNEFPSPVEDGTLCTHVVKVGPQVCYVRLDFLSFSMNSGPAHMAGHLCTMDWFTIIGSSDGLEQISTMCGEKAGHSMFIPVSPGQNLILSTAVQSRGQAVWDIQATQVSCGQVTHHWTNDAQCGLSLSNRTPKDLNFNPENYKFVPELPSNKQAASEQEMENFIPGLLFPNPAYQALPGKHFSLQSYFESKEWSSKPASVNIKTQNESNPSDIHIKDDKYEYKDGEEVKIEHWNKQKNEFDMFQAYPFLSKLQSRNLKNSTTIKSRRGRPRVDHWKKHRFPRMKRASPLAFPWIVKIMLGPQLMCVGTVVHPYFVLTSASCVLDSSRKTNNSSDVMYIQSWNKEKLISFYKIVIHHQWEWYTGDFDLALIQTLTPLRNTICLNSIAYNFTGVDGLQTGYKNVPEKSAKEVFHLFQQNVTILEGDTCQLEEDDRDSRGDRNFCLTGTQLDKWAAGSPLEVAQLTRHYLVGFVSHQVSTSCSKVSLMTKVFQAIKWITAVCTEAVPVRTVS